MEKAAPMAVHWLNNKELVFSQGAEKLLAQALMENASIPNSRQTTPDSQQQEEDSGGKQQHVDVHTPGTVSSVTTNAHSVGVHARIRVCTPIRRRAPRAVVVQRLIHSMCDSRRCCGNGTLLV